MIPTPYCNHHQFIKILRLIFSSFVILMPSSTQYHLHNNLIADIWWCGVIIQPLRSICLPSRNAFYSVWKSVRSTAAAPFPSVTLIFELRDMKTTVFFVFAALFQCNQGQQDGRVEVEETAGGPALTDRWMRTRAGEHFFLHFDQWQMTDSIKKKKKEKDARQMLPTRDTGDKWQCARATVAGG